MTTRSISFLVAFLVYLGASGQTRHSMWSNKPATLWRDALVSGNGKMGIMVFGNPAREKIICNHEFLYEFTGWEAIEPPDISGSLKQTQQLILQGKYKEAADYTALKSKEAGHPHLLDTDPYHPAFSLAIDQPQHGQVKNYRRETDFETGEIIVRWEDDNGIWERKSFVSRKHNVIVQSIKNLSGRKVDASIALVHEEGNKKARWGSIKNLDTNLLITNPVIKANTDGWISFQTSYTKADRGYEGFVKVVPKGGVKKVLNNGLDITGAKEILLIGRINFLELANKSERIKTKNDVDKLPESYESLLATHAPIQKSMFLRTDLQFPASPEDTLPVEDLFALQEKDAKNIHTALLKKMYEMGKYVLITASGDNPPNLVGKWTGDWRPTWSGDFTLDANVNLQVAGVNTLQLYEALDSYLKMLERIAPDWEINAKKLYGARGFKSGIRTNGKRNLETHFGSVFVGHFWTAGAQWLIYPAFEYYLCSGDKVFLRNRLLPLMEKVALFYEDFLKFEDSSGHYVFVPSYSPENSPKNIKNDGRGGVKNATMDIAAAKQALSNILFAYAELGIRDKVKTDKWTTMLKKMPPYLINKDGALQEWASPELQDNYNHRHSSLMYPFWPSLELNPDEHPELTNAARVALSIRGDEDISTHGIVMKGLAASRLKMDTLLQTKILQFLSGRFINTSLVTNHFPDGRVYNCDGVCCFPGVINEMMVYSKPGEIELLPALAPQITKGKIAGVACRTKAIIKEMSWDMNNKSIDITIVPLETQTLVLSCRKGIAVANPTSMGGIKKLSSSRLQLSLQKGVAKKLSLRLD